MPFLDYNGLEHFKANSDKLYLPVSIQGSLTGAGASVTRSFADPRITDTMVPRIEWTSDTSVITGNVTVIVDTGTVAVTAVVNGTVNFTITLGEEQ